MVSHLNIFLVEDDPDDQEIFLSALNDIDPEIKCEIASNGEEGLKKLNSNGNAPSLIFLDLNMPVMNGEEFLQHVKKDEELRHIPVVVLSTASDHSTVKRLHSLGAYSFLTKPSAYRELVDMLKPVLMPTS